MTNYKYLIIGHFTNGEPWEETAKNKRELAFVLNKIDSNPAAILDTIEDKNGKENKHHDS